MFVSDCIRAIFSYNLFDSVMFQGYVLFSLILMFVFILSVAMMYFECCRDSLLIVMLHV